jgi:Flp pilus assembly protein TadG
MTHLRKSSRRGTAVIEFAFVGVPMILITISVVSIALEMWQYSSLSYATEATARYASMHGASCRQNGNTCGVTVGDVTTYFANQAVGMSATQLTLTLSDSSGATTCSPPFTSCDTSSSAFPSLSANNVGSDITVKATIPVTNPVSMFWGRNSGSYTLGATSTQRIAF